MENIDSQDKRGPVEEFYTDAHADFNASFEDALLLELGLRLHHPAP